VQEALTNARKHGAGAATVRVRYSPEAVELDVRNPAGFQGESGGRGLAGMEERVRLYGGRLLTGAEDGEFRVQARLPL
jgi:signal transduction histidine kinase